MGYGEVSGIDFRFALPFVCDERAVFRGGVIETGDVVALGFPRLPCSLHKIIRQ